MVRAIVAILAGLVAAAAGAGGLFAIGMRRKHPALLDAVRRTNRRFFNPQQMQSAGTPGAYAGVIHHRGRTTGRACRTPVGASMFGDDAVITLPYGERADWLRNVLAAGEAVLDHEGDTFDLSDPRVVDTASVAAAFSAGEMRINRIMGVDQCLRARATPRSST